MPLDALGEIAAEIAYDVVYEGFFKPLFHATGRRIIRTLTFNRAQIQPNKRKKRVGTQLRPTKTDNFAVLVGLVFWVSVIGAFCYWLRLAPQ